MKKHLSWIVLLGGTILAIVVASHMLVSQQKQDTLKLSVADIDQEILRSEQLIIMTQGRIETLKQLKQVAAVQAQEAASTKQREAEARKDSSRTATSAKKK